MPIGLSAAPFKQLRMRCRMPIAAHRSTPIAVAHSSCACACTWACAVGRPVLSAYSSCAVWISVWMFFPINNTNTSIDSIMGCTNLTIVLSVKYLSLKLVLLKSHQQTHTGGKPYECNKCKVAVAQKQLMMTHLVQMFLISHKKVRFLAFDSTQSISHGPSHMTSSPHWSPT